MTPNEQTRFWKLNFQSPPPQPVLCFYPPSKDTRLGIWSLGLG